MQRNQTQKLLNKVNRNTDNGKKDIYIIYLLIY